MAEKEKPIMQKLRVVEALQDDAYKGIARIDPSLMKKLKLERGDLISINGQRETFAIVDKAYPADQGENIIRIDGIIRKNAKTGIGEMIDIKKAELREAKKITIAPAQQGIMVQGSPDAFKQGLLGRAVVKGDIVVLGGTQRRKDIMSEEFGDIFGDLSNIFGQMGMGGMQGNLSQIRFAIVNTNPNQPVLITENTEITLNPKAVEISEENIPQITYEDIGGLTEEVKKVREMVELPLKHPEIFARLGIKPPKGVLLHGPPGTGKTLLAKAVAYESEAHFIEFNLSELNSMMHGQTEKNIQKLFEEAEKNAPSIIFIDEIDSMATKREERGPNEFLNTPVIALLKYMDGLKERGNVIIMAATNRLSSLDEALRRPGRFDREVEIGVPQKEGRLQILKIHTRGMPLTKDVDLDELASKTHGFVGADIEALGKEAAMAVLRKHLHEFNLEDESSEIPQEILNLLKISHKDFIEALKVVRPSAMREVLSEKPNIGWNDIGGLEEVKKDLKEAIEWPLKFPESFVRMGIRPPKGILLYGPPGTGKTLLAKAVAKESEANFISVKGPELLSKWVNDSQHIIKKLFNRARRVSPCIIFFDEIDSIGTKRIASNDNSQETSKALNQILTEIDGIEDLTNIIIIGATNRPDMLDSALLRPGRFDRIVYVPVPEKEGRLKILKIHTKNMPIKDKEKIIKKLAEETEGYTGADLESLTREAGMLALRENKDAKEITEKNFEKAMEKVAPSVTKADQERYKNVEKKYLRSAKSALPETTYAG